MTLVGYRLTGPWKKLIFQRGLERYYEYQSEFVQTSTSLFAGNCLNICVKQSIIYSKACVCGRSLTGIAGSNLAGEMEVILWWMLCFFSDRGLCVRLITRPEKSYRVWCLWL
jgi:hypothetical protein